MDPELNQPENPAPEAPPQQAPEPMIHVFSPDGVKGQLPQSKLPDALRNGYDHAVRVTSPEGKAGWMPAKQVGGAVATGGYTVGQPMKITGDKVNVAKDGTKSFQPNADIPTFGPVKNFALNAAQTVWPSDRGPIDQAVYEAKQLYNHPADMLAESFRKANPIRMVTDSAGAEGQATIDAAKNHDAIGAIIHGVSSVIPGMGRAVGDASEKIRSGDVSGGLGTAAGLLGQVALADPETAEAAAKPVTSLVKAGTNAITKVPEVASRGYDAIRTIGDPVKQAEALPAEKLAIKATKPRNSINDINGKLQTALPDARRAADTAGIKVDSLDSAQKAVTQAKKDVWSEYESRLGPNKDASIDGNKVADSIEGTITKRFEQQNPKAAEAIREKADSYRRPMSLGEAEDFLQDTNNELSSHYAKNKISQRVAARDPSTAHTVAEANALRDQIYGKLDELTGPGAADIKQRYGALATLEDVLQRRVNVADRAAPESLIEQMGKVEAAKGYGKAAVKLATGRPLAAAADAYGAYKGYKASKAARQANDSDFLIGKAFDKTSPTPAARPYTPPEPLPVNISPPRPAPYRFGPGQVEAEQVGPPDPSEKVLAGGKGVVRRSTPLLEAGPGPTTHGTGPGVIDPEYLEEPSRDVLANNQGTRVRPVAALPPSPIRGQLGGIRLPSVSDSSVMNNRVDVPRAPSASAAADILRDRIEVPKRTESSNGKPTIAMTATNNPPAKSAPAPTGTRSIIRTADRKSSVGLTGPAYLPAERIIKQAGFETAPAGGGVNKELGTITLNDPAYPNKPLLLNLADVEKLGPEGVKAKMAERLAQKEPPRAEVAAKAGTSIAAKGASSSGSGGVANGQFRQRVKDDTENTYGDDLIDDYIPGSVRKPEMKPLSPEAEASLPPFLRKLGARLGFTSTPIADTVAHVDSASSQDKRDIKVDRPDFFTRAILAHEATHVFQHTRKDYGRPAIAKPDENGKFDYNYGGLEGLKRAAASGKTIADFPNEKQAKIIEDYYRLNVKAIYLAQKQGGFLTPKQADQYEAVRNVVGRLAGQLAGIPSEDEPDSSEITPPRFTPGPPSHRYTGRLDLDPTMVGTMQYIPVKEKSKE